MFEQHDHGVQFLEGLDGRQRGYGQRQLQISDVLSMLDGKCDIRSLNHIHVVVHLLLLLLAALLLLVARLWLNAEVLSGVWLSDSSGVFTLPKDEPI